MTFTVSIVTNVHTWPDPRFDAIQHTLGSKPFFDDGNSYLKFTYHFLMVRLKIAYWEFDFEAVCPTLDHDLLSQAHIYIFFNCYILLRFSFPLKKIPVFLGGLGVVLSHSFVWLCCFCRPGSLWNIEEETADCTWEILYTCCQSMPRFVTLWCMQHVQKYSYEWVNPSLLVLQCSLGLFFVFCFF